MGEETFSGTGRRSILPFPEDNIPSRGEGAGVDGTGGVRRSLIGVDAHPTNVVAEARLEKGALGGLR